MEAEIKYCAHCVSNRKDVFTGRPSSMVRVKEMETFFVERCNNCAYEMTVQKNLLYKKIRRNDAQGVRDQHMSTHWRDTLQPISVDGGENKLFTKTYGWNPASQDPRVPKDKPKWDKT